MKKEIRRNIKGDVKTILKKQKESGFVAGLKKAGCYGLGALTTIYLPLAYLDGVIYKGIGLPFDNNSFINKAGDAFWRAHELIPYCFTQMPEEVLKTEITGSETH